MNNSILANEEDRISSRQMDELFKIEKLIGEIAGVISLQSQVEEDRFIDDAWEEFPEPPPVEEKPKQYDEDGNEIVEEEEQPPAEEDDGEPKKPVFDPSAYKWTITNRRAKNLP